MRFADGLAEPLQATAVEHAADDEQPAVDDAPGDVAADRCDQELPDRSRSSPTTKHGGQRERQRHDEAEQQLPEALTRRQAVCEECHRRIAMRQSRAMNDPVH